MNVVKLLGPATQVLNAPDPILLATKVMLQHNHAGGNAHLITHKNAAGDVLGSFYLAPHSPIIIDKEPTDTLETEASVTDIFATKVAYMG